MTRRKNFICLFIALIIVFSAIFIFPLTASAANVTIGSSLFTNTKNMTIKATDDGLALRVDQKEFAYAEWANTLPMDKFSMDFKIIDDNFEELVLTFTSMYDESVSNDYDAAISAKNSASDAQEREEAIETIKSVIQPEKIKDTITLIKESNEIKVGINGSSKSRIGSSFKGLELTVSYDNGIFTVKNRESGETKNEAAIGGSIKNNEATLRIDFPKDSIKQVRKDTTYDDGETIYGDSTLLIEKFSYYNINKAEQQEQSLKGAMVEDTSKPILKYDNRLLSSSNINVPIYSQYKIPVYGIDIIKSLSNLTVSATVKFYDNDDKFVKDITVNNLAFEVRELSSSGYYLIEKITLNDGTNTLTFEDKDGSIRNINGITLPIRITGVDKTSNSDPNSSFNFNIGNDYAELFEGIPLKGGSKNKVVFPMPIVGSADFSATGGTGVRSYVNGALENPYNITYKLYYQYETDSSWTESSSTGLEFTATKTGTYKFKIEAWDRQSNKTRCDTIIELTFIDTESPEMTVSNFPDEITVNESFTIPTASTTDDFDTSPTKKIELYYLNDGTKGERIKLENGSFTPDDDMLGKEFIVIYTAVDAAGHEAIEVERTFKVVEAKSTPNPFFKMDTLSIIFLCLGGASLLGIIALLLIKPKEN